MEDQNGEKRHKGNRTGMTQDGAPTVPSNVIQMMMTLLMRREDFLRCLQLDMEYVMHLNTGEGSILKDMMVATKDLHQQGSPAETSFGLRMIELLQSRFQKLLEASEDSPLRQNAKKVFLMDAEGKCH